MRPNLKIYWETKLKSRFHANDTLPSVKRTSNPFLLEISSCKCGADWPDSEMGQGRGNGGAGRGVAVPGVTTLALRLPCHASRGAVVRKEIGRRALITLQEIKKNRPENFSH